MASPMKAKKTAPKPAPNASCPKCGDDFTCRKDEPKCWCAELPALADPKAGESCLCRGCLERETAKRGGGKR